MVMVRLRTKDEPSVAAWAPPSQIFEKCLRIWKTPESLRVARASMWRSRLLMGPLPRSRPQVVLFLYSGCSIIILKSLVSQSGSLCWVPCSRYLPWRREWVSGMLGLVELYASMYISERHI